jgi:hypothetical protein
MSLINDALKRANQNQPPPPETPPGTPLVAVGGPAAAPKNRSGRFVPVLVLAMLCVSAFFFWKWRQAAGANPTPALVEQGVVDPAPVEFRHSDPLPPSTVTAAVAESVAAATAVPQSAVERAIATGPVVVAPAAPPRVEPTTVSTPIPQVAAPTPTTPIRLQAILFRLRNPTVIINGRTLELGQSTDGAKVVDIQRNHVIVERGGQQQTLELP